MSFCDEPSCAVRVPLIKPKKLNYSRYQMAFFNVASIISPILAPGLSAWTPSNNVIEKFYKLKKKSMQHIFDWARYILGCCSLPVSYNSCHTMSWPLKGQRSHQTHNRQLLTCVTNVTLIRRVRRTCIYQYCWESMKPESECAGVKSQNWIPGTRLL